MPRRYSRHYYDMYRLGHSEIADRAIAHPELLAKVVALTATDVAFLLW